MCDGSAKKVNLKMAEELGNIRQELKDALSVVIRGLENGKYTREEMDTLSHVLGMLTFNIMFNHKK